MVAENPEAYLAFSSTLFVMLTKPLQMGRPESFSVGHFLIMNMTNGSCLSRVLPFLCITLLMYHSKITEVSVMNRYIFFNLDMLSNVSGIWSHHDTAAAITSISATPPTVIIIIFSTCSRV
jgi:hypothetical protein